MRQPKRGAVQHGLGQDQAVGHDHQDVRTQLRQDLLLCGVPQRGGLEHGYAGALGALLDRAGLQLVAPARGPVRLGVHTQ